MSNFEIKHFDQLSFFLHNCVDFLLICEINITFLGSFVKLLLLLSTYTQKCHPNGWHFLKRYWMDKYCKNMLQVDAEAYHHHNKSLLCASNCFYCSVVITARFSFCCLHKRQLLILLRLLLR